MHDLLFIDACKWNFHFSADNTALNNMHAASNNRCVINPIGTRLFKYVINEEGNSIF